MNLELKHLQLIYNIETLGSLSKCAEAMYISQPAASHLLKKLEDQLDVVLYHRINKKMVLTKAGKVLLNAAMDILPKMEKHKKLLSDEIHGEKGTITIATECHTSYAWLPGLVKSFQEIYPNIAIDISVEATGDPLTYLAEGKIDLAIMIDPIVNSNFEYHKLFKDEVLLVVPKTHRLSTKKYIKAADIATENYIMYPEDFENNSVAKKVLTPENIRPKKITKLQLTEAIIEMVHAEMGVTAMSNWLLRSYINNKELMGIKIGRRGLFRKWSIVSIREENAPKHLSEFIRHFQKEVVLY